MIIVSADNMGPVKIDRTPGYTLNNLLQRYVGRTAMEFCVDHGVEGECDKVSIQAPRGTLVLTDVGSTFERSPSVMSQAMSVAGAAARVMTGVVANLPLRVPEDAQAERLKICEACEFYKRPTEPTPGSSGRCLVCGCYTKYKTSLTSEACPRGNWDKHTGAPSQDPTAPRVGKPNDPASNPPAP